LVWSLYQKISNQVIVAGMGEVLGVKFEAIQFILDLYCINEIELRRDIFEKILKIDEIKLKKRIQKQNKK